MIKSFPQRKTKIVATIGPASSSREVIRDMIQSGMNLARLNFSHGTHDEHSQVLHIIREEALAAGKTIAVFQDLCGPKIRIGILQGGSVPLTENQQIRLRHADGTEGSAQELFVEAFNPVEVMKPGDKALLGDGQIELQAEKIDGDAVLCIVRAGGVLRSRSGISVPDSKLNLPCLTEKDLRDLEWGIANDIDYIALSFVGTASDVVNLKSRIKASGKYIPVISKIERAGSMDHLTSIVESSDAVMIARGDLGLELPLERVPGAQRHIIETANFAGTPVITATQMLVSMVQNVRPTRAEVSDVSTAVRDRTDAVMLSEETAIGKHPALAIRVLDSIIREAEKEMNFERFRPQLRGSDSERVADAVCYAACSAADKISASAIVACTLGGYTARLMAKYRPNQILFGATSEKKTLARMAVYWGVEPVLIKVHDDYSTEDEVTQAMIAVRDQYGLKPGSRVVVTAGLRAKKSGTTNVMEIRDIPRSA